LGAPSLNEFIASFLVASWYEELKLIHEGESLTLIPQVTRRRLRECCALLGGVGTCSHLKVDLGRVEMLNEYDWLPEYEPSDYVPEIDDDELSTYAPSKSASPVEPTLEDMLPEEEPMPEPVTHGDLNLEDYLGEDAGLWLSLDEYNRHSRRRYRRLW